MNLEFLEEEIKEIIKGEIFEDDESEYNVFIFESLSEKKIFFYSVSNLITSEIMFSKLLQFDTIEEAEFEYNFYKGKTDEE